MNEKQRKTNPKNDKLKEIEERILTFIEHSSNQKIKTKPFKRENNIKEKYTTIRDSLVQLNHIKENESSITTQSQYQKDNKEYNNLRKSINIKKELLKGAEPRFKLNLTPILQPKFIDLDLSNTMNNLFNQDITKSIADFLETDEKIPQNQLAEIEKRKKDILIGNNFDFQLLKEEEKCYEDIIKDFKGNGLSNIKYKQKISASYLTMILNENYTIGNIFINFNEINEFIIREICVFLLILFIDEFDELNDNELNDFINCLFYCHLNFLFILMLIVKNTKEENLNSEIDKLNYKAFQNCKNILSIVEDKINYEKFKKNFHNQNKIIKNLLIKILNNLGNVNKNITEQIKIIFNSVKTSNINEVIINKIPNNNIIISKLNSIIKISKERIKYNTISENKEDKNLAFSNQENSNNNNIENEESEEEILIQPDPPFLPLKDINDKREYTLVLDLDETLVHYFEDNDEENAYVKVRMGAEKFIKILSQYCEIVIFTASTEEYANIVIDGLDCSDEISFRLYRQHTNVINGYNVKDLSKLGRDISKMIIIDNIEENYNLQPDNGLNISDFEGDENDNELIFLLEDLMEIVQKKGIDVRTKLPEVRKKMQRRYSNIN